MKKTRLNFFLEFLKENPAERLSVLLYIIRITIHRIIAILKMLIDRLMLTTPMKRSMQFEIIEEVEGQALEKQFAGLWQGHWPNKF